ncbi:hypothetical protein M430DRAFT_191280 [Amorphotheca resinae ATCC 22711]|uniref:Uncharacterized protein n=1 Tax=Amorphotheca resinae ATCC 22711 TaxID=857342 RepID=A0A2T3APR1_AMORE|nr:hypothetical protein M430DRAFT_191280 [Amorphotheca resinae ATCC 22711]PSS06988.1 hypothetical protein M430DRAFT_191280 [Amorphotheca resinae ATCC 22711]
MHRGTLALQRRACTRPDYRVVCRIWSSADAVIMWCPTRETARLALFGQCDMGRRLHWRELVRGQLVLQDTKRQRASLGISGGFVLVEERPDVTANICCNRQNRDDLRLLRYIITQHGTSASPITIMLFRHTDKKKEISDIY